MVVLHWIDLSVFGEVLMLEDVFQRPFNCGFMLVTILVATSCVKCRNFKVNQVNLADGLAMFA